MSKALILDIEEEINYSVIGITSNLKDYRLTFYINKLPNIQFKRVEPFVFHHKNIAFTYSLYVYVDNKNLRNYYLISNKDRSVKLVPKFQHFDYLLIMDGEIDEDYINDLTKELKASNYITLTSVVDFNEIEKIKNLRASFDYHLDTILSNL
ncbi:MAG: IPExxxVDY family protein [Bacteroidales bacterium]|nr:IPExxxVDY family protein [Bacteroidales bacterium]